MDSSRIEIVKDYEFVMVKKSFLVPNPGKMAGMVQFYEFVTGMNPDGEEGFATISEPRFSVVVISDFAFLF